MSQEGNHAEEKKDEKQHRNSLFRKPETVYKNKSNALEFDDIECSEDDDETEVLRSYSLNGVASNESNFSNVYHDAGDNKSPINVPAEKAKPAKFCNIPINHVSHLFGNRPSVSGVGLASKKLSVPQLIPVRRGEVLNSNLLPDLKSIKTNGPDDCSSMYGASDGALLFGQRKDSLSSQSRIPTYIGEPPAQSRRRLIPHSSRSPRSILVQEQLNKEHEQYSELLQRMVPRLYGMTDSQTKPNEAMVNKKRQSFLAGRRSINEQENRPPPHLTSAISLTDDEDEDFIDLIKSTQSFANVATILNDDENDLTGFFDLANEQNNILSSSRRCNDLSSRSYNLNTNKEEEEEEPEDELPYVTPVNTLKEKFELAPIYKPDWLSSFRARWDERGKEKQEAIAEAEKEVQELAAEGKKVERQLYERMKRCTIFDPELVAIDEFPSDVESEDEEEEPEIIEFSPEQQKKIQFAVSGPRNDVLITKFNMSIARRDIETLTGLNWLNDEVINFYMNLLMDRSEKRHKSDGLPRVYSMNTFFIPRLLEGGHSAVRRWTRKVNIFERDVIPVPVHVGGVHWCMAIIHLKNKTIKYYDSMASPNPKVLEALSKYLQDESLDKLKQQFDTSDFTIESISNVPRQFNGSDCGVFSCMFAEYITRDKQITFTQEHMPYFRQKMILEIVQGELIM